MRTGEKSGIGRGWRQGGNRTTRVQSLGCGRQPRPVSDPSRAPARLAASQAPRAGKLAQRGAWRAVPPARPGGAEAQSRAAPYLLVDDRASHLADVRQAVVPGRVLRQHRLAAPADLQMEGDAPGRPRQDSGTAAPAGRTSAAAARRACCPPPSTGNSGRPQAGRRALIARPGAPGSRLEARRLKSFAAAEPGLSFFKESKRKIKLSGKVPARGKGEGMRIGRGRGGEKMAEAGAAPRQRAARGRRRRAEEQQLRRARRDRAAGLRPGRRAGGEKGARSGSRGRGRALRSHHPAGAGATEPRPARSPQCARWPSHRPRLPGPEEPPPGPGRISGRAWGRLREPWFDPSLPPSRTPLSSAVPAARLRTDGTQAPFPQPRCPGPGLPRPPQSLPHHPSVGRRTSTPEVACVLNSRMPSPAFLRGSYFPEEK